MMDQTFDRIQEALERVRIALEETEDEGIQEELEGAVEALEAVERDMQVRQEMDEMMRQNPDDMEGADEL